MKKKKLFQDLDLFSMLIPLGIVSVLCVLFIALPQRTTALVDGVRGFLGENLGVYYLLFGVASLGVSLFFAFSRIGRIRLGQAEKPEYTNFQWGAMIFTSTMAADILYYSFIEWALYAQEDRVAQLGSMQDWASTYPIFHWGPIPWSFYVVLAVCFAFMLQVRGREKQKFSEACRPLLGRRVDGAWGRVIDLIAVFALLAGTATTFSLATPLLGQAISHITGLPATTWLTVAVLVFIAVLYTVAVLFSFKGIVFAAKLCIWLFGALLVWFLAGGQARYILETGVAALGNLAQNFIGLATYTDPLRQTGFVQNWTVFYWAYWMVWCVATPFFIGTISKGRTIRNVVLGAYLSGLAGTYTSFIVFGNYGLGLQTHGRLDVLGQLAGGAAMPQVIIDIFGTLPLPAVALVLLILTMCAFYSTTFDSLTMVISMYSCRRLKPGAVPPKGVRAFWAVVFIIFPIGLIFAQNSLNSLQSVSIIAALPISVVMVLIVAAFLKDVRAYLKQGGREEGCGPGQSG